MGLWSGAVFVYNCTQDWRDYKTDRAKAAYDTFMPLDGKFDSNVVLQIKNGPMDFQIREPVSPLFGGLSHTNQMLELQITQEYTGQQRDLCYLVPMWKEVLDFDTFARGQGSAVKDIVAGKVFSQTYSGIAGVANVGSDPNWTGHTLAQANLYGFARLCWDPNLSAAAIAEEWIQLTFGPNAKVREVILEMLLRSREIYENYTVPLGIGWMVNPGHHYGPNVDGYEYDRWGRITGRTAGRLVLIERQREEPVLQGSTILPMPRCTNPGKHAPRSSCCFFTGSGIRSGCGREKP